MVRVNDVYQTVLTILNKEQRGYMTPFEFNKIAAQVQQEIFERYFDDLNQQARAFQTDVDYADRLFATEEKLEVFRTTSELTYNNGFTIPNDLYKLGNVTFRDYTNISPISFGDKYVEAEQVTRHEFNLLRNSNLAAPTRKYPQYLYEGNKIKVLPLSITADNSIIIDYIKKPTNPIWAYTVGSLGEFIFSEPGVVSPAPIPSGGSVNFELQESERTEIIINILFYAGVVIRDPQVVQVASQKIQQEEVNEKQ
tara:strand:- start:475 stop:1233 length:759 start_codon:yes stop_codon:yes gene_type:complete